MKKYIVLFWILFLPSLWSLCFADVGLVGEESKGVESGGAISLNTGHSLGDMVACYIINEGEGSTLNDLTSNEYDLTLSGGYSWVSGGVSFDGIDAEARGTHAPFSGYPSTLVTIMKPAAGDFNIGIGVYDVSSASNYTNLSVDDTLHPRLTLRSVSGNLHATGSTVLTAGTEYVVTGVYTGTTDREIWLDGSTEDTDITSATMPTGLDTICIGAYCDSSPVYFIGTVIAAYIYDRALSDADVATLAGDPYAMINNYSGP